MTQGRLEDPSATQSEKDAYLESLLRQNKEAATKLGGDTMWLGYVSSNMPSLEEFANQLERYFVDEKADMVITHWRVRYLMGKSMISRIFPIISPTAGCISIACNRKAELSSYAEIAIEVDAGPEILTGSTRLKAGTCQKMICNMLSTASMVGIGKVYGNLMVDMKATNQKLVERAKRIVMQSTGCSYERAEEVLEETGYSTKEAIVMLLTGSGRNQAVRLLEKNRGFVRKCRAE